LALAAVALSRLAFLTPGYGVNVDAWRVARVARQLSETGIYEVSRFPGYPVQEILFLALARRPMCIEWWLRNLQRRCSVGVYPLRAPARLPRCDSRRAGSRHDSGFFYQ
jgi:hypothetical protein